MTNISVNDFAVLITYLCFLVETTENLEIQHTFSGCDKAGYSILLQIIWKHGDGFFKIIPVMSDFNQVLCLQKKTYINVKFALDQANGSQLQVSQNPHRLQKKPNMVCITAHQFWSYADYGNVACEYQFAAIMYSCCT